MNKPQVNIRALVLSAVLAALTGAVSAAPSNFEKTVREYSAPASTEKAIRNGESSSFREVRNVSDLQREIDRVEKESLAEEKLQRQQRNGR